MYSSWFIFKEERQRAEGSRWFAPGQDRGEPTNVSLLLGFGPEAKGLSLWGFFFLRPQSRQSALTYLRTPADTG